MPGAGQFRPVIALENTKAFAHAREFLRWSAEETVWIGDEFRLSPSNTHRDGDHERIVIAVRITARNFLTAMATHKIVPALAACGTVILKPASEISLTADVMARLRDGCRRGGEI